MVSSRFYQPAMASFTKSEQKFLGLAEDAGLSYFLPEDMTTRRVVTVKGINENTQITYNFSFGTRINKLVRKSGKMGSYGASGISFRLLYEFLCAAFNDGEYFIDTYLNTIFDTRAEFDKLNTLNDSIIEDIENERGELEEDLVLKQDGTPDMRYSGGRRYASLGVWNNPDRASAGTAMAKEIQDDIIRCLANGRIPLRKQSVSNRTSKIREQFIGLSGVAFFYASGQLIRHLNIFIGLKEE